MDVDLSHKSICELHFDSAQASPEEALVASRVKTLKACHNHIERVVGLHTLFHRLTLLDLAHNKLGSAKNGQDMCAWLAALPSSLRILNLSHNGLHGFFMDDKMDGDVSRSCIGEFHMSLTNLRRSCPLTIALFFNCNRFPELSELDLSHNALHLTQGESDRAEEIWQKTMECSAAVPVPAENRPGKGEYAAWLRCVTCSIEILHLDGNVQLSALNGLLCGMEKLTHLHAADCDVKDLAAVSAASTFCPKLCALDLRKCPVVQIFTHAPQSTVASFVELLLVPFLLQEEKNNEEDPQKKKKGCDEEEQKRRRVLAQEIAQEVAGCYLDCINNAISRHQSFSGGLRQALFAILLQQVIPQVSQVNDGVNVEMTRRVFMDSAREAIQQLIDNKNRQVRGHRNTTLSHKMVSQAQPRLQKTIAEQGNVDRVMAKTSQNGVAAVSTSLQDRSLESDSFLRRSHCTYSETTGSCSSSPPAPAVTALSAEKRSFLLPPSIEPSALSTRRDRRSRSRSALGMTMAASAASAAAADACTQLRPSVLVRSTTDVTLGTDDSINGVVSGGSESITTTMTAATVAAGSLNNSSNTSAGVHSVSFLGDGRSGAALGQKCKGISLFKTPLASAPVPVHVGDNSSSSEDMSTGSRFRRALAALTPLLRQRLRTEGLSGLDDEENFKVQSCRDGHEEQSNSVTTSTSTLTLTTTALSVRESLMQQAQALEETLLASQDRQRSLREVVVQLNEQLRRDRRLIIDQRKETARLKQEKDMLVVANRNTRRKLKKRQSDIAYGAAALQRREAESQRRAALEHLAQEEELLIQTEKKLYEKMALSVSCSHAHQSHFSGDASMLAAASVVGCTTSQQQQLRKTRADLLRENAVRERIDAVQKKDPLVYSTRKFRPSEYPSSGVDETSNFVISPTIAANTLQLQHMFQLQPDVRNIKNGGNVRCIQEDDRVHGKTPWRRDRSVSVSSPRGEATEPRSLYDKGYSPYCETKGGIEERGNREEGERRHCALQELSLHQLFEEAAAIKQQQQVLQQRMREMSGSETISATQYEKVKNPSTKTVGSTCIESIKTAIERSTPSTRSTSVVQRMPETASRDPASQASCCVQNNTPILGDTIDNGGDNNSTVGGIYSGDDNESVHVVVSVEEGEAGSDWFITPAHPPSNEEETRTRWQEPSPEKPQKGEDVVLFSSLSAPPPPLSPSAAREHFSVDARSIYEEIVRQKQLQQKPQQLMEAQQIGCSFPDKVEEPLPVSVTVNGARSGKSMKVFSESADFPLPNKENCKSKDDTEGEACRQLFF